jgi:hypothetical protein
LIEYRCVLERKEKRDIVVADDNFFFGRSIVSDDKRLEVTNLGILYARVAIS